jgi:hypothetical protein
MKVSDAAARSYYYKYGQYYPIHHAIIFTQYAKSINMYATILIHYDLDLFELKLFLEDHAFLLNY